MKEGNWIPLDKNLVHFLPRSRPYTILEAMFSFRFDVDNGDEKSEIAYSRIWSWSRSKVRRFVTDLKTGARHAPDSRETGKRHEVRIIFNNLEEAKDRQKTGKRQAKDRGETGTINPNPKEDNLSASDDEQFLSDDWISKKKRKLEGKRLETFKLFWEAFDYRKGRAGAIDSWLDIPELTNSLVAKIVDAAKAEAKNRPSIVKKGLTPIWPQGWLTGRRWEDELVISDPVDLCTTPEGY